MTKEEIKTRLLHQDDLMCFLVGGCPVSGSLNEFEAARLKHGDVIEFITSSGECGEGVVDYVWLYESPMVQLANNRCLNSSMEVVRKKV